MCVLQGVLRSKCVRLPEGVDALEFGEEWSEDRRLEYGRQEGRSIVSHVSDQNTEKISFQPFLLQTSGSLMLWEARSCAEWRAEGECLVC